MSKPEPITFSEASREGVESLQRKALVAGVAGLGICLAAWVVSPVTFYQAYLIGYMFWWGIALGSCGLVLLHHLVGGSWGVPLRRPLEAAATTILPLALLFIPLIIGIHTLYPWAKPAPEGAHAHLSPWLDETFFLSRAAGYFVFWALLALAVNLWSFEQDGRSDHAPSRRLGAIAGPAAVLLFTSGSFAAIDWVMTLEPHWTSTIFGAMVAIGALLATLSAMAIVLKYLSRVDGIGPMITPGRLHDLGNLMLAFTMLWAYFSFAQFLIIWSGNLSEEIPWYLRRSRGGWEFFVVALLLFHFLTPFFILLNREGKRRPYYLAWVASWILCMRVVDLTWLIVPATNDIHSPRFDLGSVILGIPAVVGIGGLCVAFFLNRLKRQPLIPLNDANVLAALGRAGG